MRCCCPPRTRRWQRTRRLWEIVPLHFIPEIFQPPKFGPVFVTQGEGSASFCQAIANSDAANVWMVMKAWPAPLHPGHGDLIAHLAQSISPNPRTMGEEERAHRFLAEGLVSVQS